MMADCLLSVSMKRSARVCMAISRLRAEVAGRGRRRVRIIHRLASAFTLWPPPEHCQCKQRQQRGQQDPHPQPRYRCSAQHGAGQEASPYAQQEERPASVRIDRKSTRLNSSHGYISYAVFCLKKKKDAAHASKNMNLAWTFETRALTR